MRTGVQETVIKRRWPAVILGLVASILVACGASPSAPTTDAPQASTAPLSQTAPETSPNDDVSDRPVIVFLGDSLTAGFGLPATAALPEQVQAQMQALGRSVTAVNAGVSGDTTGNGLARYNWSVRSAAPDMLVIALGANDYILGLSPQTARANLAAILDRAKADNIPVILAGLEPRTDISTNARDAAYAAIYSDLATQYDVPLYPALLKGVRDTPALLQADGLHPTEAGVRKMASQFATFLNQELAQPRP